MGRLIDADKWIEKLNAIISDEEAPSEIKDYAMFLISEISAEPTAYDIEKVVAELEEMIKPKQFYFCKYAKGGCKYIDDDKKDCIECVVEHAIDIVKRGGIDEIPMDESYK